MQLKPLWFWLVLWLWPVAAYGQEAVTLTADQLANGQAVELDKLGWKYSPHDDPRFAEPQFDDRAWETLNGTAITLNSIPKSGWQGSGWFRLRLKIDPALQHQPLALVMAHHGASAVYLDGKLLQRYGTVGATPDTEIEANPGGAPLEFSFAAAGEHLLAVRRSQARWQDGFNWRGPVRQGMLGSEIGAVGLTETGFRMQLDRLASAYARRDSYYRRIGIGGVFVGGIFATLGFLHLLLFFFYPPQRANLWFGLWALGLVLMAVLTRIVLVSAQEFVQGVSDLQNLYSLGYILTSTLTIFLLAFLYASFEHKLPKFFYVFTAFHFLALFIVLLFPYTEFSRWIRIAHILVSPFIWWRVVIPAYRRKESGALLIGLGVTLWSINPLHTVLGEFGYAPQAAFFMPFQQAASLFVMILFSVYLARQFARTSRNLENQLEKVMQLSVKELDHERERARHAEVAAENERRARELEEARQLQLSMLPKKLPNLPHLDIGAFMKTATEVGGDYYDFHTSDDGTLTIAVGDATGHGLKAGTMVASVKSLFMTLAYHPDIPHIFTRLSQTLKQMNLRGLFMALTIAKVKGNRLTISLAGMPPVWIYRAATHQIEEVALQQLPLGGVTKYVYQQREYDLASGDIVVLLSDGLPERFNPAGEMLEDEAAKQWLIEHAHLPVHSLIEGLAQLGDEWGGTRPQDDDVTFVVLKIR